MRISLLVLLALVALAALAAGGPPHSAAAPSAVAGGEYGYTAAPGAPGRRESSRGDAVVGDEADADHDGPSHVSYVNRHRPPRPHGHMRSHAATGARRSRHRRGTGSEDEERAPSIALRRNCADFIHPQGGTPC